MFFKININELFNNTFIKAIFLSFLVILLVFKLSVNENSIRSIETNVADIIQDDSVSIQNQAFLYILDAGHGETVDCGYKSILEDDGRCFYEWIYNWEIRRMLAIKLDSAGIQYRFTNTTFEDISLNDRVEIADNIDSNIPKILISIHGNAASMKKPGWETPQGFAVFSPHRNYMKDNCYPNKKEFSDYLAKQMGETIKSHFPKHYLRESGNSRHKVASFTIISKPQCYSILTENEFFTNPNMRKMMRTEQFKLRVAQAHFDFIKKIEKSFKIN